MYQNNKKTLVGMIGFIIGWVIAKLWVLILYLISKI